MTLRELWWAAEGRQRAEWERLGELMALQANLKRPNKKAKVWHGWEFNPYEEHRHTPPTPEVVKVPLKLLRNLFVSSKKKKGKKGK